MSSVQVSDNSVDGAVAAVAIPVKLVDDDVSYVNLDVAGKDETLGLLFGGLSSLQMNCVEIPKMEKIEEYVEKRGGKNGQLDAYMYDLKQNTFTIDQLREMDSVLPESLLSELASSSSAICANHVMYRVKENKVFPSRIGRLYGSSRLNMNDTYFNRPDRKTKGYNKSILAAVPIVNVQQIQSDMREYIFSDTYKCADMANCYPTMLLEFIELFKIDEFPAKIGHSHLREYVLNRDEIIQNIATHFDCSKTHAKQLILCVLMGGNIVTWIRRYLCRMHHLIQKNQNWRPMKVRSMMYNYIYSILYSDDIEIFKIKRWLNNFRIEIDNIVDKLLEKFPHVAKEAEAFHFGPEKQFASGNTSNINERYNVRDYDALKGVLFGKWENYSKPQAYFGVNESNTSHPSVFEKNAITGEESINYSYAENHFNGVQDYKSWEQQRISVRTLCYIMESMETICMSNIYNYCRKNNMSVGGMIFDSIMFIGDESIETYCEKFGNVARECGFKYVNFRPGWTKPLTYPELRMRYLNRTQYNYIPINLNKYAQNHVNIKKISELITNRSTSFDRQTLDIPEELYFSKNKELSTPEYIQVNKDGTRTYKFIVEKGDGIGFNTYFMDTGKIHVVLSKQLQKLNFKKNKLLQYLAFALKNKQSTTAKEYLRKSVIEIYTGVTDTKYLSPFGVTTPFNEYVNNIELLDEKVHQHIGILLSGNNKIQFIDMYNEVRPEVEMTVWDYIMNYIRDESKFLSLLKVIFKYTITSTIDCGNITLWGVKINSSDTVKQIDYETRELIFGKWNEIVDNKITELRERGFFIDVRNQTRRNQMKRSDILTKKFKADGSDQVGMNKTLHSYSFTMPEEDLLNPDNVVNYLQMTIVEMESKIREFCSENGFNIEIKLMSIDDFKTKECGKMSPEVISQFRISSTKGMRSMKFEGVELTIESVSSNNNTAISGAGVTPDDVISGAGVGSVTAISGAGVGPDDDADD